MSAFRIRQFSAQFQAIECRSVLSPLFYAEADLTIHLPVTVLVSVESALGVGWCAGFSTLDTAMARLQKGTECPREATMGSI